MFDINKVDKEVELFIFDIYIAILKIKKVASKFDNGEDLLHSFTDWDSVIREFEIIGEASKYLLRDDLLESYYRRMVDFRNHITHEYFGIDYGYGIWQFRTIPVLMPQKYNCWGCVGATGAFMFYHPGLDAYLIGNFNDVSYKSKGLRFMLEVIKKLLKVAN